jgi:hypothetical protein
MGCILMENMSSSGFSASMHRHDYPAALGGILDFGGMAAIFEGLEPAGLLYLECLQAKV